MDGDCRTELGVNAVDVGTHHVKDQYVIDWVVNTKTPIYLRNDAAFGYETAKGWYQKWKSSAAAPYVCGIALLDEPPESSTLPAILADDARAFREVFPGLPVILNLNVFGNAAYLYTRTVNPDFLSYEVYMVASKDGTCNWAATWVGNNNDVDWMCNQAKDVFTNGGMKIENNQRIMIVFGTFGFNSCIEKRASVGVVFGYDLFYQIFTKVKNNLGGYFGGAKNYAWCTDDDSQVGPSGQRDHMPYSHEYVRPYVRYLNNLIYDANLSTPWNLGVVVTPPSGTGVSIAKFYSDVTTLNSGSSTTLRWEASNYTSLSIDNGIGVVTGNSKVISPVSTTTYKLTATGNSGSVSSSTTVVVSSSAPTSIGLDSPPVIYANSKVSVKILNLGGKTVTKARVWFNDGSAAYVDKTKFLAMNSDGQGFVYAPDSYTCDGGMFYLEFDGSPDNSLVVGFRQISRPTISPSSISGNTGQFQIKLSQSNGESFSGSSSDNIAVATVTHSGTTAVVNLVGAGSCNIILTPLAQGYSGSDLGFVVPVTVTSTPSPVLGDGVCAISSLGMCLLESTLSASQNGGLCVIPNTAVSLFEGRVIEYIYGNGICAITASGLCLFETSPSPSQNGGLCSFTASGICLFYGTSYQPPTSSVGDCPVEVWFE